MDISKEEQISVLEHLIDQTQRKLTDMDDGTGLEYKLKFYQSLYKSLTTNGTNDRQCNNRGPSVDSHRDHSEVS